MNFISLGLWIASLRLEQVQDVSPKKWMEEAFCVRLKKTYKFAFLTYVVGIGVDESMKLISWACFCFLFLEMVSWLDFLLCYGFFLITILRPKFLHLALVFSYRSYITFYSWMRVRHINPNLVTYKQFMIKPDTVRRRSCTLYHNILGPQVSL